jgi:tight adherence protein B
MTPWLIYICVFAGVVLTILGISVVMRTDKEDEVSERLAELTGKKKAVRGQQTSASELLVASFGNTESAFERYIAKHLNLQLMFEQADVSLTVSKFMAFVAGAGAIGFFVPAVSGLSLKFAPFISALFAFMPFAWLILKRKRRLRKFASQLPEALELIARALRAGHSLASGFSLVAQEMSEPIGKEFGRTFEEQNLGVPLEETLENLTERVPNLDLKFFVTAIILQRQTGGDLAEILDKIGNLIRERFKIWGQVQALTGEGRLSGIVLLALPPALFVVVYRMNPDYLMLLFTDDLGKKMLVGGIVMQLLGALLIRKIVNIRV